ncbi:MAG: outer rane lipoprotein carrier protein LolA [Solirubrobacterales bacterium]|nr:outer rane lipoprotein carrier protein LolA [Solirubrobacterales bacterium]
MSSLRRLSTRRLASLTGGALALIAAAAVLASSALSSGGAVPPAKPLAAAIHDALAAPAVSGLTARIAFTDKLVDSSILPTGSPLLKGGTGRLWASADGRARLELQSDNGDTQIVLTPQRVTLYDQQSDAVYQALLPADRAGAATGNDAADGVPTIADIQRRLADAMGHLQVSGATPGNVHGISAYTVRVAPARDGGLVGGAELAWDAATGVPLRAAVYQQGGAKPVLELAITDLNYGSVSPADLGVTPPAGAKVTTVDLRDQASGGDAGSAHHQVGEPKTLAAAAKAVPFTLSAPATLAGMRRGGVRVVGRDSADRGVLVTYGTGLGGLAVLETAADPEASAPAKKDTGGEQGGLPQPSINGNPGQELSTALGTGVRFTRSGVRYVVVGSVRQAVAEAAARGL